jgi:hypothetical protein
MKLNVPKFRNLIRKTTLNYSIDFLQLNFDPQLVKSAMISGSRDALTNVCLDNDFITGMGPQDRITLNFHEVASKVSRYLDIAPEEVEIDIEENKKIILTIGGTRKVDIFMIDDSAIAKNVSQRTAKEMKYFISLPMDDTLNTLFEAHKKIAPYYGKIYFGIQNKRFFIESTDRTNSGINRLNDEICDVDGENMVMCFEFRNFLNLITVIEDNKAINRLFDLNFTYSKTDDRGLIYAVSKDEKEKYFIVSRAL